MMRLGQHSKGSLHRLLEQELEYFNEMLDETKAFFDHFDSSSIDSLLKLLDARQKWINMIEELEQERKKIGRVNGEIDLGPLEQDIANVAETLIVIDAKIFDILQMNKSKYVNEMARMAGKRVRTGKMQPDQLHKSKVIDILHE